MEFTKTALHQIIDEETEAQRRQGGQTVGWSHPGSEMSEKVRFWVLAGVVIQGREDKGWALSASARDKASSPGLARRPEVDASMAFPYIEAQVFKGRRAKLGARGLSSCPESTSARPGSPGALPGPGSPHRAGAALALFVDSHSCQGEAVLDGDTRE